MLSISEDAITIGSATTEMPNPGRYKRAGEYFTMVNLSPGKVLWCVGVFGNCNELTHSAMTVNVGETMLLNRPSTNVDGKMHMTAVGMLGTDKAVVCGELFGDILTGSGITRGWGCNPITTSGAVPSLGPLTIVF